jgi:hypothetical protein
MLILLAIEILRLIPVVSEKVILGKFKYFSTLTPSTLLVKLRVLKTKGLGDALWQRE